MFLREIIKMVGRDIRDLVGNETYHATKKQNNKDVNSPQNKSVNLRQFK